MSPQVVSGIEKRTSIYGVLALIFRKELTQDLLSTLRESGFLNSAKLLGYPVSADFVGKEDTEVLSDLECEYSKLFIGPGRHISPYESVHRSEDSKSRGTLMGDCTIEVKKFIEYYGLKYKDDFTALPDHMSVELEFMQKLLEKETELTSSQDFERVEQCRKVQKEFFNQHLIKWIPGFCDEVIEQATMNFYREAARLTKDFILSEKEVFFQ